MKVLLNSLIILLFSCQSWAVKKYVATTHGSDLNGGTSWADAWATFGKTDGNLNAGDTLLIGWGTYSESWTPTDDGSFGNLITVIDSAAYTDGWNESSPDTSIIWGPNINTTSQACNFSGDTYFKIIGISFSGSTNQVVLTNVSSISNIFQQCKFFDHGDGSGSMVQALSDTLKLISCLFLPGTNGITIGFKHDVGDAIEVVNCTFYGNFSQNAILSDVAAGDGLTFKNNIVDNNSTGNNDFAFWLLGSTDAVVDWNWNLYQSESGNGNTFNFSGTTISTFSVWVDSVKVYDVDGESNSDFIDAGLQATATSCYITTSSSAYNAGTDLGYGDDIGYYQVAVAPPSANPGTKKKGRPIFWNYKKEIDNVGLNINDLWQEEIDKIVNNRKQTLR